MPITKRAKVGGFSWSDFGKPDYKPIAFNGEADRRLREQVHYEDALKIPSESGRRTDVGTGARFCSREDGRKASRGGKDGWFGDYQTMKDGIKQHGSGREWFAGDGKISRLTSSGSPARKAASAHIAKIPLVLARHIARVYHPENA